MTDFVTLIDSVIGPITAAVLTVMVLSYVIGDNALFRVAVHVFIGVAAGYAGAAVIRNVLLPALISPLMESGLAGLLRVETVVEVIVPLLLIAMLLLKLSPRTARLGGLPMALLVGVAAAVIVGGAVTGTLLPQSLSAMDSLDPSVVAPQTGATGFERIFNVALMLLGTISTLLYFRFTRRETSGPAVTPTWTSWLLSSEPLMMIGRAFIAVTFGVMFAGALSASIMVLAERVQSLWGMIAGWIGL
jgi:hypothetical protein